MNAAALCLLLALLLSGCALFPSAAPVPSDTKQADATLAGGIRQVESSVGVIEGKANAAEAKAPQIKPEAVIIREETSKLRDTAAGMKAATQTEVADNAECAKVRGESEKLKKELAECKSKENADTKRRLGFGMAALLVAAPFVGWFGKSPAAAVCCVLAAALCGAGINWIDHADRLGLGALGIGALAVIYGLWKRHNEVKVLVKAEPVKGATP